MISTLQRVGYRLKTKLTQLFLTLTPQPKTTLLLGPDSSLRLCAMISQMGYKNILIVTDRPLVELGMIAPLCEELKNLGVVFDLFDEVEPDPTDNIVLEGAIQAKKRQCDAILAVGGGSSMDAAKVIAVTTVYGNACLQGSGFVKQVGLPVFAIPTTSGTGSEATVAAVITNSENHTKMGIGGPGLATVAAALDPLLTSKLPPHITAATGLDALTHAIEAFIGGWATDETDRYALSATKLIFSNLQRSFESGDDLASREAMAIASTQAGFAISKAGVGYVHAIAHQLGARYGIPHGLANAVVLPHILEYSKQTAAPRLAQLAKFSGIVDSTDDLTAAQQFIDKIVQLNIALDIPTAFKQIEKADIPELVQAALKEGSGYPVPVYMDKTSCTGIIESISIFS